MNLFIILFYFILFPFGQLLRFEIAPYGIHFAFHLLDLVVLLSIPIVFFYRTKPHLLRKYFYYFWYICFFSLLLSATRYPITEVIRASLYLIRFISYYFFFEVVWNYIESRKQKTKSKETILSIVLYSLLTTAILGWLQYLYAPDLRYLKLFNWDDHFYRLTGTILDPGFMGILMVFGSLISEIRFVQSRKIVQLFLTIFFLITLGFTYSRASYLALILSLIVFLFSLTRSHLARLRIVLISVVLFCSLIYLLPKGGGEGVNLLRTNSIFEKATNYQETIEIISDFPVFGVGYNTLCSERMRRFDNQNFDSHSCSGSDSSFLFILATTGVIGLFAFIKILFQVVHPIKSTEYSNIIIPVGIALFIHSLFLNSLFYPWVMGIIATLLALTL
jgi:hypothetical protein